MKYNKYIWTWNIIKINKYEQQITNHGKNDKKKGGSENRSTRTRLLKTPLDVDTQRRRGFVTNEHRGRVNSLNHRRPFPYADVCKRRSFCIKADAFKWTCIPRLHKLTASGENTGRLLKLPAPWVRKYSDLSFTVLLKALSFTLIQIKHANSLELQ